MVAQLSSKNTLSQPLCAVLSSLNVDLEAELIRYRRNRLLSHAAATDIFEDLDDPAIDLASDKLTVSNSETAQQQLNSLQSGNNEAARAVDLPMGSSLIAPPPLPRNKKLFPQSSNDLNLPDSKKDEASKHAAPYSDMADFLSSASARQVAAQVVEETLGKDLGSGTTNAAEVISATTYLDSSEKLLESLSDIPPMPEPIQTSVQPRRKTVSLLAGAALGFLGLAAGLGASYLMSNPQIAQRLADGLKSGQGTVSAIPQKRFDPPGPDLSVQEFVEIDIDTLSYLDMPTTPVDPAALQAATQQATSQSALPPIAPSPGDTALDAPQATIPANANYYVTVPFSTEQGLISIRQSIEEAFVRQFSNGNQIQLAAFDNAESAQQFIEDIKGQGITAQIYGPTNE